MRAAVMQLALRLVLFGAAWWVLVEGDLRSPLLAGLMIALAAATSMVMLPGGRLPGLIGLVGLVFFFVRQSILAGVDVLRRALHPGLPLRPGFVDVPFGVQGEPARALVASVTSLLPGTLSVDLGNERLRVHVLDTTAPVTDVVRALEGYVARVFREPVAR